MLSDNAETNETWRSQTGCRVMRQVQLFCAVLLLIIGASCWISLDGLDRDLVERENGGAPTAVLAWSQRAASASPQLPARVMPDPGPVRPAPPAARTKDSVRRQVAQYVVELPAQQVVFGLHRPASTVPGLFEVRCRVPATEYVEHLAALDTAPRLTERPNIPRGPPVARPAKQAFS